MNTTTLDALDHPVDTRPARPKLLYPALVIAAISVTLFSLLGIAALTGVMPSAHSNPQAAAIDNKAANAAPAGKSGQGAASGATSKTRLAAASCVGCGTVQSVTTVERPAKTSGVGAVAGGLTGALLGNQMGSGNGRTVMTIAGGAGGAYLGNKIEQNTSRTSAYKIVVRMEDGSLRTVYQAEPPNVVIGGPVQIVGNAVVARS
jgi:outer membrane lipoprotein SlyB